MLQRGNDACLSRYSKLLRYRFRRPCFFNSGCHLIRLTFLSLSRLPPSHRIHESSDGTMLDNRSFQANGNVRHESVTCQRWNAKIFQFSVLFFPLSVVFLLLFLFVFFKIVISHVKYLSTCALVLAYLKCLLPLAQLYDLVRWKFEICKPR